MAYMTSNEIAALFIERMAPGQKNFRLTEKQTNWLRHQWIREQGSAAGRAEVLKGEGWIVNIQYNGLGILNTAPAPKTTKVVEGNGVELFGNDEPDPSLPIVSVLVDGFTKVVEQKLMTTAQVQSSFAAAIQSCESEGEHAAADVYRQAQSQLESIWGLTAPLGSSGGLVIDDTAYVQEREAKEDLALIESRIFDAKPSKTERAARIRAARATLQSQDHLTLEELFDAPVPKFQSPTMAQAGW